ncbi:MAG: GDP-mannose mannosyl hydrolase [Sulfurimonas sp.]|jgi:colanic acid biosynthesis protein WcaH|nr:GDP-mannose mannosyl hydrolase [Sulfurimonas sp.]
MLKAEIFIEIIKNTPLISVDLITKNDEGKVLLGKRVNEPARNFWFVPGGRIFKDESLDDAFSRICQSELGVSFTREKTDFYGLYEHFYTNNVFNNDFSTHYVVLAYKVYLNNVLQVNDQHEAYQWFEVDELLDRDDVHPYTKNYFKERLYD